MLRVRSRFVRPSRSIAGARRSCACSEYSQGYSEYSQGYSEYSQGRRSSAILCVVANDGAPVATTADLVAWQRKVGAVSAVGEVPPRSQRHLTAIYRACAAQACTAPKQRRTVPHIIGATCWPIAQEPYRAILVAIHFNIMTVATVG